MDPSEQGWIICRSRRPNGSVGAGLQPCSRRALHCGDALRDTLPVHPRTLSFLRSLKRNNDRTWFAEHKDAYERDVHQPVLALVDWMAQKLPSFAPDLEASPRVSLFRIYRDTRFSADKSPFKTQVGAVFPHRRLHRNESACLYLEIGPAGTMIAGGIYKPERPALLAIREHVARNHRRLRALLDAPAFVRVVGEVQGDPLRRVPPGYAADHPAADFLRFRQFLMGKDYPAAFAASPEFPGRC